MPENFTNDLPDLLDEQELSKRLKDAREFLGLSQEVVAEKLGMPRPSISAIESCKRKVSSIELKRMAELYRQPYEYFLGQPSGDKEGATADDYTKTLFRTTKKLNVRDRDQVLKFAQFLQQAGQAPEISDDSG